MFCIRAKDLARPTQVAMDSLTNISSPGPRVLHVDVCDDADIDEQTYVEPVSKAFGDEIDRLVNRINLTYLVTTLDVGTQAAFLHIYEQLQDVCISVNGSTSLNIHRDCTPQLMMLLAEACSPESLVQLLRTTPDCTWGKSFESLWALFPTTGKSRPGIWSWVPNKVSIAFCYILQGRFEKRPKPSRLTTEGHCRSLWLAGSVITRMSLPATGGRSSTTWPCSPN